MIEVVEDVVSLLSCRRVVHLMSDEEMRLDDLAVFGAPEQGVEAQVKQELGVFHLRGEWAFRGAVEVRGECWPRARRMVVWPIGGRVSAEMQAAAMEYLRVFRRWPGYAFIRQLPRGAEEGVEVDGVMLLSAEWAPPGCLVVGG